MGSILCEHCAAACCRYLALPIDKPTTKRDFDDIRWYLMHEGVSVFVEDGDWYVQYQTRCKNLGSDNRCTIYETRPEICAEYEPNGCDYQGGDYGYDHLFTHAKQIEAFYREKKGVELGVSEQPRPKKRRKTSKRKACV
ncbi:MAG: YkgJ family cysteine cluster protein [Phycisphaerae bacterium]|jgi:Fe-S-cluster containining protein